MDKKIQLSLEFLAKCDTASKEQQLFFADVLNELSEENFCAKTIFTCKQLKTLLNGEIKSVDEAMRFLQKHLLEEEKKSFSVYIDNIFNSLLSSNFPSHAHLLKVGINEFEASLEKVEAKIYTLIKTYIDLLCLVLELYIHFDEKREKKLQDVVEFGKKIHLFILKHIFYEEEIKLLNNSLEQLLSVYIGVYFNFCYQEKR